MMVEGKKSVVAVIAGLIFGDEDYDAWDGAGVYVGRLPQVFTNREHLDFVRACDVRLLTPCVEAYGEILFTGNVIESLIDTDPRMAVRVLFEHMSTDLKDKDYLKNLGLNQDSRISVVGTSHLLIKSEPVNDKILFSVRVNLAEVEDK